MQRPRGIVRIEGYTGDHNVALTSGASVFATKGAGGHYPALGSPHRNAGPTDLAADFLADLGQMTTEPPIEWSDAITADTLWEPWIERDWDTPDLGYHCPPLDDLCGNLAANGATLTLTNGVAVGVYGSAGIKLAGTGKLINEGWLIAPNRLVRAVTVQE